MQRRREPGEEAAARGRPGPCWRRPARRSPPRARRRSGRRPASSAASSLYGHHDRVGDGALGDAGRAGQPEGGDAAARRRRAARRRGRGSSRRTSGSSGRPVAPRASRTAVIAASVPDDTSRTFSTDGTRVGDRPRRARPRARSARRTTCRRGRGALHRLDDRGVGVAEDRRAPRLHVVDVAAAVGVDEVRRPRRAATKNGSPPTDVERPHRRVDAAGDARLRPRVEQRAHVQAFGDVAREVGEHEVGAGALDRRAACSSATASPSIQPLPAAAFTIAYSPLTWYAATGTSNASRSARDDVEVRQRGLHHHHVGALGDVERGLVERLAGVGRVHLVAAPVAELRRALGGVAERSVQRRRVLRRVGEDRGVGVARLRRARRGSRRPGRPSSPTGRPRRRPASACAIAIDA